MVELRLGTILPIVGVGLLSLDLVGCVAPGTITARAESQGLSSPDIKRSNLPPDIHLLVNHPAVESIRQKASEMGWVTAVARLPRTTADVRPQTKPSLAKRTSMFLHEAQSENSQEFPGDYYLPGQNFPVSYTVETFIIASNQKKVRRDRWSVENKPPQVLFVGVRRQGVDYALVKPGAPAEYWRLEGRYPDGSFQATRVELLDLMDAEI